MKTKTLIETQLRKKTNSDLVETIIAAKKNKAWNEVAGLLSSSRRNRKDVNVSELDKLEGKTIVVAGKVLSQGEVSKKFKVVAMGFSEKAKEKLLNAGCEVSSIVEEIKSNPEAKDLVIFGK